MTNNYPLTRQHSHLRCYSRAFCAILPLAALLTTPAPLRADDFNRTASGDWNSANWVDVFGSNSGPPQGGDFAAIGLGHNVTISSSGTQVGNLYLGYNYNSNLVTSAASFLTVTADNINFNTQIFIDSGSILTATGGDAQMSVNSLSFQNNNQGHGEPEGPDGGIIIGSAGTASSLFITNKGEVDADYVQAYNSSIVTIDNGDLEISHNVSVNSGSILTFKNGGGIDASGGSINIGDNGGAATLSVQSAAHVILAQLSIDSGSATIDGTNTFVNAATLFAAGNVTIQNGSNISGTVAVVAANATLTVTGGLSSWTSGGAVAIGHTLYGSGHLSIQSGGQVAAASMICDSTSSILISGSGTFGGASSLTVTGNLYTGYSSTGNAMTINTGAYASDLNGFIGYLGGSSGTVLVTDSNSLWANSQGLFVNASGSLSIQNGAQVTASTGSAAATSSITIGSNSKLIVSGNFANSAAISLSGSASFGSLTGSGSIADSGTLTFTPNNSNGSATNSITGNGKIQMAGNGTVVLSSNPSFTGSVQVNSGTIRVGNSTAFGSSSMNLSVTGTLDLNANNLAVTSLTGSGVVDNFGATGSVLTVSSTLNPTFFGSVRSSSAALGLTVSGTGTLSLYGTNSYTGATTVNAGATLAIDTPSSLPIGGVIVNNGTLHINANGATSVASPITGSGSLVMASSGTLTLVALPTGGTVLSTGTTIVQAAGSNHSFSSIPNANLTFSGGKLDLSNHDLLITGGTAQSAAAGIAMVAPKQITNASNNKPLWVTTAVLDGQTYRNLTGHTTFDAQPFATTDLLFRYGLAGDITGTGQINPDDYLALDDGYARGLTGYAHGDLNHDGVINAADYALIDLNYLDQGNTTLADGLIADHTAEFGDAYTSAFDALLLPQAVPEPASLVILAIGAIGLLNRRRR